MKLHVPRVGRNDSCPCGSGKKYKHCHAGRADNVTPWQKLGVVLVVGAVIGGLLLAFSNRADEAPPTGVWSAEHGHYH
jgi:SEC-C motif-containing protein